MEKWKIIWIGIKYNYGFYNGWFLKFKIWKKNFNWHSTDRLVEAICMKLWIYKEYDMRILNNKRFKILDIEKLEDWSSKYEIEIVNKKINPDKKSVWIYGEG